jgi:hypothetical protein
MKRKLIESPGKLEKPSSILGNGWKIMANEHH